MQVRLADLPSTAVTGEGPLYWGEGENRITIGHFKANGDGTLECHIQSKDAIAFLRWNKLDAVSIRQASMDADTDAET